MNKLKRQELTQEKIKQLLHYNSETGLFIWLISPRNGGPAAGDVAGKIYIKINGINYRTCRLAWLYKTGEWPINEVDHKNGISDDNRWKNLRDVTHSVNLQNRQKATRNNKTGLLGVCKHSKNFRATIVIKGKKFNIGTFITPELAHTAYLTVKRKVHEGCTI